jgi:hypothetical protein
MSETAIAVRESAPPVIVPRNLAEMIDIAERIAKSNLLPEALRGKVPEVLMQIMAGQELGLYSMASLRSFNIIQGKPVMSADAMVAVVLGSGKAEYFRRVGEGTSKTVTYATKRRGEPEQKCTWTIEMAKEASLHQKDNWRGYPRAMLASRAKSELARDVYPDVLAGCYTPDEIGDHASGTPREPDAIEAEFVDVPASTIEHSEIAKIDTIDTIEALKAHSAVLARLPLSDVDKRALNERYKARMAFLKTVVPTPHPASSGSSSAGEATSTNSGDSSDASTGSPPEAA